jgi:tetratricopeptide (TPR) repeat protein
MKHAFVILIGSVAMAQTAAPDRVAEAVKQRSALQQMMRLKTDDRIDAYKQTVAAKPHDKRARLLLASAYIQKVRETTDFSYLDRAAEVIASVLAMEPSNYEALRLRSEVELERHNFAKVVEVSRELTKAAPNDPWNWGTLGDALIELGRYDEAADAFQTMVNLRPDLTSYNRVAHYRFLTGDMAGAIRIMNMAVTAGSSAPENVAWCLVELGGLYVKKGSLAEARAAYETALRTFPAYHSAHAGLGRVLALEGDTKGAIEQYRRAQAITPLPDYSAALYDLYLKDGQSRAANQQMQLIEVMDRLGQAAKEKTNRNLALIYADHDRNLPRALELAKAELESRRDIYSWDAYAWALYKNGQLDEARSAIKEALKLGTPDPLLKRHASLIGGTKNLQ